MTGHDGTPLSDIRSPDDNERTAELVRRFTDDPDSSLH
ncbi:MAG: TIGR02584 family CRISPR-associated protein, partial [Methylococcaceae bacterium]|nr:TIGR02584 family CRISPR-associated protein [Methylococcaceae bacterium]